MKESQIIGRNEIYGAQYFGGMEHQGLEDLYRLPDQTWILHSVNPATMVEPSFVRLTHEEAVDWLIELRRCSTICQKGSLRAKGPAEGLPQHVVPHDEPARIFAGSRQWCAPPPVGQIIRIILSPDCKTMRELKERQDSILEPSMVLERVLWPSAADEALAAGFKENSHDDLLQLLRVRLEERLLERPRISIFQSLQDRGCDQLIEWGPHAKFGIQIKSYGDIRDSEFARNTIAQIQDSRQHGLQRLYLLLAGDLSDASQAQKVRGLHSRISAMNDRYVRFIPEGSQGSPHCLHFAEAGVVPQSSPWHRSVLRLESEGDVSQHLTRRQSDGHGRSTHKANAEHLLWVAPPRTATRQPGTDGSREEGHY
ncbi:MAG TPA: hypothetical protein VK395_15565 [Gemmataceae bacterium]|nr:hypothetical protein [Gemmataceae bacterium]